MTNFKCDAGHLFHYPAKYIVNQYSQPKGNPNMVAGLSITAPVITSSIEESVCPECKTLKFSEFVEPTATVESVYVYELGTGPQTELNGLLAQGYVIVNRYAKAYHLEKPKAKVEQPDPDCQQALTEAAETTQKIAEATFKETQP